MEPQLPLGSILTEAEYAERILLLLDDQSAAEWSLMCRLGRS